MGISKKNTINDINNEDDRNESKNLTEGTKLTLGIKAWWALVILCFTMGAAVSGYQIQTSHRIEALYQQQSIQHEQVMIKLKDSDERLHMYALKSGVENSIIYIIRRRDLLNGTDLTAQAEVDIRNQVRTFLSP